MTLTRSLFLLASIAMIPACGGSDPDTADDDTIGDADVSDDGDVDDTGDTGTADKNPVAGEVRVMSFFGFDPVTYEIYKPEDYRTELVLTFTIEGGTTQDDPNQNCVLRIDLEGLTADPNASDDGWLWALDIPGGQPYDEDCTDREFDFQTNEMRTIEEWVEGPYRLMIGSEPTDDVIEWLEDVAEVPGDEIDNYFGGMLNFPSAPDGNDDSYWTSSEIDGDGKPVEDGEEIDRFSILNDDGELDYGYYVMRQTVYWYYY